MYSAMPWRMIAFQASSINMIFRIPLSLRILLIKTSMIMMVTVGKQDRVVFDGIEFKDDQGLR